MRKLVRSEEFIAHPLGRMLFKLVQPIADKALGFHALNECYRKALSSKPKDAREFCEASLKAMETTVEVDPNLLSELKCEEPVIVVSNHPYGGIDSMAFLQVVDEATGGKWKMLANEVLRSIVEMEANIIPVYPHNKGEAKAANLKAIKEMHRTLKGGGTLAMFPAARVSGRHPEHGFVCDLPWTPHPLALAARHGARIVYCHISGSLSERFLSIDPRQLTKRSLALAKEVANSKGETLRLTHSSTMNPTETKKYAKFKNADEVQRAHTYLGADKTEAKRAQVVSGDLTTYMTDSSVDYHERLRASQEILMEQGDYVSFIIQGCDDSTVMEEIGRLRAKTFSFIGAGSGKEVDLSPEDDYYHHMIVTEKSTGKIAGAYRVGFSDEIIKERGHKGLYLNGVFNIQDEFYDRISSAMELSRSFVPVEFQKSPVVLDVLWRSLGRVAIKSGCRSLYGSVTISADFTPLSQAILVDTLDRYYSADPELRELISNDNPFESTTTYHPLISDAYAPHGFNRLNTVIQEIEDEQRPIPPLMRYYATLGAKFFSFKVEPTFGNAIYCLLQVKIDEIPPRHRKRFFGV